MPPACPDRVLLLSMHTSPVDQPGSGDAGGMNVYVWHLARALAQAGINRLSMGVQALDDAALSFLGRNHSAAEALRAVDLAGRLFPRLSIDLIYARPDQTPQAWAAELTAALALGFEHVSPYQLTIEPTTAFGRAFARGTLTPPDEERAASLYETTQDVLAAAGFEAYEVSNHARGPAARSSHNLHVWRGGDYVGVGPGAHGRLVTADGRMAQSTEKRPEACPECGTVDHLVPCGPGVERIAEEMLERGVYVIPFSYPVVPKGEARIRVQLSADHSFEQIDRALSSVKERTVKQSITLDVDPELAQSWLVGRLPALLAALSGTSLTVLSTPRYERSAFDRVDIALRYGYGEWDGFENALICGDRLTAVGSPALLEARGLSLPLTPEQVLDLPLLGYTKRSWIPWLTAAGLPAVEPDAVGVRKRVPHRLTHQNLATGGLGQVRPLFDGLSQRGCLIALDDFGTGYASFEALRRLPTIAP